MLVVYRHFLGESHPAAGEGPEGVLGGRGGRVDGARSESGAAREQAVIGEVVEGRWCADSARWASSGRHVDHRDRRRVMISM